MSIHQTENIDWGEMMRCFALATLMGVSILVTGATTALPDSIKDCTDVDKCIDYLFKDRPREESPPPQQHPDVSPADWYKNADKLRIKDVDTIEARPRLPDLKPFHERFKDETAYEQAVLDLLRKKYPEYFSDPNGQATKYARIVIQGPFGREEEPEEKLVEYIKEAVVKALRERENTTEARKKASQRVAKRPSALQEAVSDPELAADAQPDYGNIASSILSIGGAVIPMVGGASVPSVRPAVRAPAPRVSAPAPVIRAPTSNSTITGN